MKRKCFGLFSLIFLLSLQSVVFGQLEEDVNDLASFGKEVKFFGYAATGTVLISRDCAAWTAQLGPDDRCAQINAATNTASFDARDIGRIRFPAKTFQNVIYMLARNQYSYFLINSTTQNKGARFQYRPYLTLESDALSDPALINPQTGQPFGGKVDISSAGNKTFNKTIFPNYQENDILSYSSSSLSGITKKYLMDNFGLSATVAEQIFEGKITIHLNIRVSTMNVEEATFNYAARFVGN